MVSNKACLEKLGVKFTREEAINFKNNLLACSGIDLEYKKSLIVRVERIIHPKEVKE